MTDAQLDVPVCTAATKAELHSTPPRPPLPPSLGLSSPLTPSFLLSERRSKGPSPDRLPPRLHRPADDLPEGDRWRDGSKEHFWSLPRRAVCLSATIRQFICLDFTVPIGQVYLGIFSFIFADFYQKGGDKISITCIIYIWVQRFSSSFWHYEMLI